MNLSRQIRSVPLRVKIILPAAVILAIAFALIAYATGQILQGQLTRSSNRTALGIAKTAERVIERAMLTGKTDDIDQAVEMFHQKPGLPRVAVRRLAGTYLADTEASRASLEPVKQMPQSGKSLTSSIRSDGESFMRVTSAVANNPACYKCHNPSLDTLGYIEVDVSTTWLKEQVNRSYSLIAAAAGATLVLVWLAITLTVNAAVLSPLNRLASAMSVVRGGARSVQVNPESEDEIGRLGVAFNKMVVHIAAAEASIIRQEQQLAKAEKLAGIGLMAAGVAHEINNPLAAVSIAAEMLDQQGLTEEQRARLSKSILEASGRIQRIVAELLTLDRKQALSLSSESAAEVAREALHSQEVPEHIRVHFRIRSDIPLIMVDRYKVVRALGNIIGNAVRAMPEGGDLTLDAETTSNGVRFVISDTGVGMSAETAEHIFDPFYSTRDVGEGFGLGLAITHGVIAQHGGEIKVKSIIGEGTSFEIVFPTTEKEPDNA